MNKPTHSVKLREGKAPAEEVNEEQLAQMRKSIVGFAANYDVTAIEQVEKPAKLEKAATTEKAKTSPEATA